MTGTKAEALVRWAEEKGRAMTRFAYAGHGESGGNFTEGTSGRWLEETLAIFDAFCRGPHVVIGSSMGGGLALLLIRELARRTPADARVARLVLIPPAVGVTVGVVWEPSPAGGKREIASNRRSRHPSRVVGKL